MQADCPNRDPSPKAQDDALLLCRSLFSLKIFALSSLSSSLFALSSLLFIIYASPILGPAFGVEIGVGISILPIVVS